MTRRSQLVAEAVTGEGFVICKAGKSLVQVTRLADAEDPGAPPGAPPGAATACWRGNQRNPRR